MQYIYSRVSTERQETENQTSRLKELYPNAAVVEEVASGAKARPMLQKLIAGLEKGDELIIFALDRLGRRTTEILALIEDLDRRGIILRSLREGVDYSTIAGRLVTSILVSISQMERELIGERTKAALAAKRKQGIKLGAKPKFSPDTIRQVHELRAAGLTVREVARKTGVSPGRVSQLTGRKAVAAA